MPRLGSTIHLCKSCEERGIVTHVRSGETLCAHCRAEQNAQGVGADGPDLAHITPEEARQALERAAEENRLWQAVVCAVVGCLIGAVAVLRFLDLLEGKALLVAVLTGASVGGVLGWFLGWNRPLWKASL